MVDINTQLGGSLTISSIEELLKLGSEFGNQLSSLSSSLWIWRISTVTSLALGTLATLGAICTNDPDERIFAVLVTGIAAITFLFSVIQWSNTSSQIANVSFLHQRALEILNASV